MSQNNSGVKYLPYMILGGLIFACIIVLGGSYLIYNSFAQAHIHQLNNKDVWGHQLFYLENKQEITDAINESCREIYSGYDDLPKQHWYFFDETAQHTTTTSYIIPTYQQDNYLIEFSLEGPKVRGQYGYISDNEIKQQVINKTLVNNAYIMRFKAIFMLIYDPQTGNSFTTPICYLDLAP